MVTSIFIGKSTSSVRKIAGRSLHRDDDDDDEEEEDEDDI
jgi:hypothetical protein